jgi:hypothetical protein
VSAERPRLHVVTEAFAAKCRNTFPFDVGDGHLRLSDMKGSVVRCYRLQPRTVFGFKKDDPIGQTRWRFDQG